MIELDRPRTGNVSEILDLTISELFMGKLGY